MNKGLTSILLLALVGVLAYFFYKKLSELHLGLGGAGDGSGGAGDRGATGSAGDDKAGAGGTPPINLTKQTGAGIKPVLRPRAPAALNPARQIITLPNLLEKVATAALLNKVKTNQLPYDAPIQAIAKRVSAANADAKKLGAHWGTTPGINKSLAELKTLNDTDFGKVFKTWQALDNFTDPLETSLCGANISNTERSDFLNRLVKLGFTK
jgi:hypothetical protein